MTPVSRRTALGIGAALTLAAEAHADSLADAEIVPLWPDGARPPAFKIDEKSTDPGAYHARWITKITAPVMMVFRPVQPDGSALLTVPGGGYGFLSVDNEGIEVARRLCRSGITVFVLLHRLPRETGSETAPLADAQRALRLIRARAKHYDVDPGRIGVIGFSAGGHVAASLATRSAEAVYSPVDDDDRLAARPAFAALMYPVVTMGEGAHAGSRENLLGPAPAAAMIARFSVERSVSALTPPCFLCLTAKDDIVPYRTNAIALFEALCAAGVPAELHVFQDGAHGFGARAVRGTTPSVWPDLMLHWGARCGWFRDPAALPA